MQNNLQKIFILNPNAETYTVEGYNRIIRYLLAGSGRKSKCYSKSLEMLKYSVILLMKYRNKEIAMFY
jgi:insertion element IS1 protein InsB